VHVDLLWHRRASHLPAHAWLRGVLTAASARA
jgi:hypothetical protein